jgi:dihydroneopterin triphosphate diphosphatase
MARAQFNILVLPYRLGIGARQEFAVLHRRESNMWQFVAGGGEDNERPFATAQREAFEEIGISVPEAAWIRLDATASIPRTAFPGASWPDSVYVIPEYCFAVEVGTADLKLSHEHDRVDWLDYERASSRLTWDSNRVALWELQYRLARNARYA